MPSLPHLRRSSLQRCLQRPSISRLAELEGDKPVKKTFKIGSFHIDIAEVQTAEGQLCLYLANEPIRLRSNRQEDGSASAFLTALINAVPYKDPHGSAQRGRGASTASNSPSRLGMPTARAPAS